jgi:hypothetical protein
MTQDKQTPIGTDEKMPLAETGNASNPSPQNPDLEPAGNNQLLDERAEKYLREVASPEDYPDEQDWQDADKVLNENRKTPGDQPKGQ